MDKRKNSKSNNTEISQNDEMPCKDNKKLKCFVMMPFSATEGYEDNHFQNVYKYIIKPAVINAGFEPLRVDEDRICDSIITKIVDNLVNCDMAICDLSSRNPNVMYELGIRQAYGKKVVLIQDDKTQRIFDVAGINTILYKSGRVYEDVVFSQTEISSAIKETFENKSQISLMSIVNISAASTEQKPLNDDDEIKFMLYNIMSRISQLENSNCINSKKERIYFDALDLEIEQLMIKVHDLSDVDDLRECRYILNQLRHKTMLIKAPIELREERIRKIQKLGAFCNARIHCLRDSNIIDDGEAPLR